MDFLLRLPLRRAGVSLLASCEKCTSGHLECALVYLWLLALKFWLIEWVRSLEIIGSESSLPSRAVPSRNQA